MSEILRHDMLYIAWVYKTMGNVVLHHRSLDTQAAISKQDKRWERLIPPDMTPPSAFLTPNIITELLLSPKF